MQPLTNTPTIAAHLADAPYVAEPQVSGALAVFPLIGPVPTLEYISFAQGLGNGVAITEQAGGASVRDLTVTNTGPIPVLLFEGEEVLGAQQNRTFDTSILVPANTTMTVPVSCVEAGRWDSSRGDEAFSASPQSAHPNLRRLKNAQVAQQRTAAHAPRADQDAVWSEVADKVDEFAATAPTSAMHDVFATQRSRLDELAAPIHLCCSQTGMIVAISGQFVVLDRVSQPDVLESLFAPLVQGYALDALRAETAVPPTREEAAAFLERVLAMPATEHDGIGLGRELRATSGDLGGAGLVAADELVQLSVFVHDTPQPGSRVSHSARVQRPSRRA